MLRWFLFLVPPFRTVFMVTLVPFLIYVFFFLLSFSFSLSFYII